MKRLLIPLALFALLPFQANAVIVSSSVGVYDVTHEFADGNPGDGFNTWVDDQVWWGSMTLAREFAGLVGDYFGTVNYVGNSGYGPFFLYATDPSRDRAYVGAYYVSGGAIASGYVDDDTGYRYARAVAKRVPEPGSILLMGAGLLGLAVARRRHTA